MDDASEKVAKGLLILGLSRRALIIRLFVLGSNTLRVVLLGS